MKKAMIVLLAVAGLAAADEVMLTTGVSITTQGVTNVVSVLNSDYSDIDRSGLAALGVGTSKGGADEHWAGSVSGKSSISFDVKIADLYNAELIDSSASITLNSFSYISNAHGWCEDEGRTVTLSVKGTDQSMTAKIADLKTDSFWVSFNTSSWDVKLSDELTVTLASADGQPITLAIGTGDIYGKSITVDGQTVTPSVEWYGVQTEAENSDLNMGGWSKEAPIVKLSVTVTPEPATATLSLLALAGLAARRKRH